MEIYKTFKKDLFWICILMLAIQFGWNQSSIGRDATDGEQRSGMALRTDAETGCQYLEGTNGGITPRLNSNGEHICSR